MRIQLGGEGTDKTKNWRDTWGELDKLLNPGVKIFLTMEHLTSVVNWEDSQGSVHLVDGSTVQDKVLNAFIAGSK